MQSSATLTLLDMCHFVARCGVPPAPFCTLTRDKRKTRSLVPAMGFKNRTAFVLFSSNTNGRVWGFCLLIRCKFSGRKPFCAKLPAIHINCPQSGQISCSRREHIEFPARETYRLKDWARTATLFTLHFFTGVLARRRCRLVPSSPAKIRQRRILRLAGSEVFSQKAGPAPDFCTIENLR